MKNLPQTESLCGWCRFIKGNICSKFNKEITPVEVKHTFQKEIFFLPTAKRCKECMEE